MTSTGYRRGISCSFLVDLEKTQDCLEKPIQNFWASITTVIHALGIGCCSASPPW